MHPLSTVYCVARKDVVVIRHALEKPHVLHRLDGKDVRFGRLVYARDVVDVKIGQRTEKRSVLCLEQGSALMAETMEGTYASPFREPQTVFTELKPSLCPLSAPLLPFDISAIRGRTRWHGLCRQIRCKRRAFEHKVVHTCIRVPRIVHLHQQFVLANRPFYIDH